MVVIFTVEAVIISSLITGVIIFVCQYHPGYFQVLVLINPKIPIQNSMYSLYMGAFCDFYAHNLSFLYVTLNIIKTFEKPSWDHFKISVMMLFSSSRGEFFKSSRWVQTALKVSFILLKLSPAMIKSPVSPKLSV